MWKELVQRTLLLPQAEQGGKHKDGVIVRVRAPVALESIVALAPQQEKKHKELHDIAALMKYSKGHPDREANALRTLPYLDSCIAATKKKGSGKQSLAASEFGEKFLKARNNFAEAEEVLANVICDGSEAVEQHGKRRGKLHHPYQK